MGKNDPWPDAAVYVSESGGDPRVPYGLVGSPTIDFSGNLVQDNYNGITIWENADRYCNSAANTSAGACTMVNPAVATVHSCNAANIAAQPYYWDCRWRSQNVKVHDNTFSMAMDMFPGCNETYCARNSVFSNLGTVPDWSPYQGDVIEQAITFSQGNVFSGNTYIGPWTFRALDGGSLIDQRQWQSAPYRQDAGSSFS